MITLRYQEHERYDPIRDAHVTRMMAISNKGTWWADSVADAGRSLREHKQFFRSYVQRAVQKGQAPCEVKLDG
jgi:hypothetical protein